MALWLFTLLAVCGPFGGLDSAYAAKEPGGRIFNGEDVDHADYAYMVTVFPPKSFGINHCSGVIIHKNWVLTAAHCTERFNRIRVCFGQTWRNDVHNRVQCQNSSRIEYPPIYDRRYQVWDTKRPNDIALVYLRVPVKERPDGVVKYIKLPSQNECNYVLQHYDVKGLIVGYGDSADIPSPTPNRLKIGKTFTVLATLCHGGHPSWLGVPILCLSGALGGTPRSCPGDSGGPFLVNGKLHGIASIGPKCCSSIHPSLYVPVCSLSPWLRYVIGDDFDQVTTSPLGDEQVTPLDLRVSRQPPGGSNADGQQACASGRRANGMGTAPNGTVLKRRKRQGNVCVRSLLDAYNDPCPYEGTTEVVGKGKGPNPPARTRPPRTTTQRPAFQFTAPGYEDVLPAPPNLGEQIGIGVCGVVASGR